MKTENSKRALAGFALIILGVLFLLPTVTRFDFSLGAWWPIFLIASGFFLFGKGATVQGVFAGGIGSLILLDNLGVFNVNFGAIWPVGLIAIGAYILLFRRSRPRAPERDEQGAPPPAGEDLNIASFFSSVNRRIDNPHFRGGGSSALFGSAEIDLRGCSLAEGAATINANALFGSLKFRVPPDWAVDIRASVAFSSIEANRPEPADAAGALAVTGSCLFGRIEVTS